MAETTAATVHEDVLSYFDEWLRRVRERLDGLSEDEYLWEPVPGCWSVRPTPDGPRSIASSPIPILRRSPRSRGACGTSPSSASTATRPECSAVTAPISTDRHFTLEASEAVDILERAAANFRAGLVDKGPNWLFDQLGPKYGPYAEATFLGLMLHVIDELVHHGAEVALLRDLYRAGARHLMADARVAELLTEVGLPAEAADAVTITGRDPVYASPFPVASSAAVALGAVAAAAALIWRDETGVEQTVTVDTEQRGRLAAELRLPAAARR